MNKDLVNNIINKGDVFKLEFDSDLPLSWMGNYTDSYFDIERKGKSTLELTYLGDTVLTKHVLPPFSFKFTKPELNRKVDDMDLSGDSAEQMPPEVLAAMAGGGGA